MSEHRQDLLEALLIHGQQTALRLAGRLALDSEEIYEELRQLKREGLVRCPLGADEWGPDPVPGCDRWMVTHAHIYSEWEYCGEPPSRFFQGLETTISR